MINENIPGIEVAVQIDGADAREYDAPVVAGRGVSRKITTKYIECIDDAFFSIRLSASNEYAWRKTGRHFLEFNVYVDGKFIEGRIFGEDDLDHDSVEGSHEINKATGNGLLRKLRFASVQTVDDAEEERVENDKILAKKLGVIKVTVDRGTLSSEAPPLDRVVENMTLELAEKSLKGKAVSHSTDRTFSEPTQIPRFYQFVYQDKGPIATFLFLYKSRDALKKEMVIPRSPTPPLPDFTDLTEADMRRLARERFEQLNGDIFKKEGGHKIKRDPEDAYDLTKEVTSKRRKGNMTNLQDGRRVEVIDLSDD